MIITYVVILRQESCMRNHEYIYIYIHIYGFWKGRSDKLMFIISIITWRERGDIGLCGLDKFYVNCVAWCNWIECQTKEVRISWQVRKTWFVPGTNVPPSSTLLAASDNCYRGSSCPTLDGHDKYWLGWVGIGKLFNKIGGVGILEFIVSMSRGKLEGMLCWE